jgi:RES domain-containing protein
VLLWRISKHDSLSGEGGRRSEGRWHTIGRPLVYCALSPAAALLELLVRLELALDEDSVRYRLLRLDADDLSTETVAISDLEPDWPAARETTQARGDAWLAAASSALLFVPSAVVPHTSNVLINPAHRDAARVRLVDVTLHELDPRLLR